jgi:FkbM family methyltransferase
MKKAISGVIEFFINLLSKFNSGNFILDRITDLLRERHRSISHKGHDFKFAAYNRLSSYRAESFSSKEPETLEWIDSIDENSVLWDIGANVGLYSIYAAKTRAAQVYSFEPSVFNLELLARNIYLNHLTDRVCIVPIALTDTTNVNYLKMTTTEWGGALSTFEKDFGWDGKKLDVTFDYQTIGISLDEVGKSLQLKAPDYIKMDVDGIEHLILQGGEQVLKAVKGVLIEVNDNFEDQAEKCNSLLMNCGLKLLAKKHSDDYAGLSSFGGGAVWNQIWSRV